MNCPYCISEIPDAALVCAVCRRDLYLAKPLLERIAALEAELAARPAPAPEAAGDCDAAVVAVGLASPAAGAGGEGAPRSWGGAAAAWLLPVALLLLAHWLLIFVYDAKVLYLRLLALMVPLPFGFLFARAVRLPFAWNLLPACLMAGGSVFGMSALTGVLDQVPVLPRGMVEVREFIEFAASIGFSFVTGLWLADWLRRRAEQTRARQTGSQSRAGGLATVNGKKMTDSLTRLNDLGSAVVGVATTVFSIYTGLKGVLGS